MSARAVLPRIALPLAAAGVVVCVAMLTFGVVSLVLPGSELLPDRPGIADFLSILAIVLVFPMVGLLIVSRRPGNPVGWLFILTGLMMALEIFAVEYAGRIAFAGATLPGGAHIAWLSDSFWILGPAVALPVAIAVFPDGRMPGSRWRPALIVAVALSVAMTALAALAPGELLGYGGEVVNPFGLSGEIGQLASWATWYGGIVQLLPTFVAIGATAVRLRRAHGAERQQMKWLLFPLALFVLTISTGLVVAWVLPASAEDTRWIFTVALAALGAVPISAGIAILRHRLYDIDVIVNRTLVYGGATVILAAAFGVANIASQRVLEAATGARSDLVTGVLAVGAAVAFGPMRRGIRPLVDRFLPARAELTLLFTDIVGSTRVAARVGDERWRSLLQRYRAAVRRELSRAGGREIDTAGDSFFATFERPAAGLRCAWAIREAVRSLGLQTRTGVHIGECEMRGESVSGLAVHTAARVMAAAGDGEIVVSGALWEAAGSGEMRVADRGIHQLKGVPGEWRLFRLESVAPPSL